MSHEKSSGNMDNNWSTSLFDMEPADDCIMAWCCPCVLMGKTGHRIEDPSMSNYNNFNNDCFMGCCLGQIWTFVKRGEYREKYGIKGNAFMDFCTSCWCMPCAVMQHEHEVKTQQAKHDPVTTGYEAQKEGMQMPTNTAVNGNTTSVANESVPNDGVAAPVVV